MLSIDVKRVVIDTTTYSAVYWDEFRENKSAIREFAEKKPMPKNKLYRDIEELIEDFEAADGVITLPEDIEEEFVEWFIELIDFLLYS